MSATPLDLLPPGTDAVPIRCVGTAEWQAVEAELPAMQRAFAAATGFAPKPGRLCLLPGPEGGLERVLFGLGDPQAAEHDRLLAGKLVGLMPEGAYRLLPEGGIDPAEAALAWLLSSYRFDRYKELKAQTPRLVAPDGVDAEALLRVARAVAAGRDLINTPANDLGPAEIEARARALAGRFGAEIAVMLVPGSEDAGKKLPGVTQS